MALLNDYYIFVIDENIKRGVDISSHPVEKGLDVTDNVKRNAKVISITGEIVGKDAAQKLKKIEALHFAGKLVQYVGSNILRNAIISSFDTTHTNTIYGGCSFSMEIQEVRIASTPLVTKKPTGGVAKKQPTSQKQVTKKTTKKTTSKKYTVKRGDTLWAIAKKYYGSGSKYTKIVNANKSKIKNPNKIQVGWVLTIPA